MCREAGHQVVLVLGHPTYYPCFGFQPAALFQISCAYDVPADAFMVLGLQEGALAGVTGIACYQPEFDGVSQVVFRMMTIMVEPVCAAQVNQSA